MRQATVFRITGTGEPAQVRLHIALPNATYDSEAIVLRIGDRLMVEIKPGPGGMGGMDIVECILERREP